VRDRLPEEVEERRELADQVAVLAVLPPTGRLRAIRR
jgi:hypothetical protein